MAWNGSNSEGKPMRKAESRRPFATRWMLAALAVAVAACAGIALLLVSKSDTARPEREGDAKPRKIAEARPSQVAQSPEPKVEQPVEDAESAAKRARREKLAAMTPQERIEFLFAEAEARPINLEPASNRVYATGTEQVLDWVFTTELGDLPPILPKIPMFEEAHLVEILVNRTKVLDTDDERTVKGKETVALAKKELVKFISDGGTAEEFLQYYHDQLRQAHMVRQEAQQSLFKLVREEPELARDYLEQVNAKLSEKGIKNVKIPARLAEHLGLNLD